MTMDYTDKIKAGLILWLKEVHGIDAIDAELNESEVERAWNTGCDTCGYGADEDKITTAITYKAEGDWYWNRLEIEGTSINFLPELLGYIDRASEELA